jgi:hypothetical protein
MNMGRISCINNGPKKEFEQSSVSTSFQALSKTLTLTCHFLLRISSFFCVCIFIFILLFFYRI